MIIVSIYKRIHVFRIRGCLKHVMFLPFVSVHDLHPGDIRIIGAMGDSLTVTDIDNNQSYIVPLFNLFYSKIYTYMCP